MIVFVSDLVITLCSSRRYPVLLQGPTSAGKTSLVQYLAKATGHRCLRVNNHEHTDLQEYIGMYTAGNDGQLVFQEGTNTVRVINYSLFRELYI